MAVLRTFCLLLFLVLVAAATGLMLLVDEAPDIEGSGAMTAADLHRARDFLASADPRRQAPGELNSLAVRAGDLELLLNYLMENLYGGKSRVSLESARVRLEFSAGLPESLLGSYLNVTMTLAQQPQGLVLESLRVGKVGVPGWFADALMQWSHEELKRRSPEYVAILEAVRDYSVGPSALVLVYEWQDTLLEQISSRGRELLIGEDSQERLLAHAVYLASLTRDPALDSPRVSVAALLGPMFNFAAQRAGDPVEENRAALLLLALYVMEVDLPPLLGSTDAAVGSMRRHRLTLAGRADFARHFLVSAGLTASAGAGIADSVALFKEMDDATSGSGFSFTDLAADRSGIRFAEYAIASADQARSVQRLLAAEPAEAVFVADFRGLPEFLEEATFVEQFGGVGSPAYNRLLDEIDARIAALEVFAGAQ